MLLHGSRSQDGLLSAVRTAPFRQLLPSQALLHVHALVVCSSVYITCPELLQAHHIAEIELSNFAFVWALM